MKTVFEKFNELVKLNIGDKVLLTNGQIADFTRLKQKKFIGTIDGVSYDIWVEQFVEVVEKAEVIDKRDEYMHLKVDEWFYINVKGNAELYKFKEFKNGKLIGVNPISKGTVRIAPSMYSGKVI